ncbi:unnamed protein product [Gordionus sp. m RMFG-2023]
MEIRHSLPSSPINSVKSPIQNLSNDCKENVSLDDLIGNVTFPRGVDESSKFINDISVKTNVSAPFWQGLKNNYNSENSVANDNFSKPRQAVTYLVSPTSNNNKLLANQTKKSCKYLKFSKFPKSIPGLDKKIKVNPDEKEKRHRDRNLNSFVDILHHFINEEANIIPNDINDDLGKKLQYPNNSNICLADKDLPTILENSEFLPDTTTSSILLNQPQNYSKKPFPNIEETHTKLKRNPKYGANNINFKDHNSSQISKDYKGRLGPKRNTSLFSNSLSSIAISLTDNFGGSNKKIKRYFNFLLQADDTSKMAVKLFGSKRALLKEQDRQRVSGYNWIIHPLSPFRFYWDVFMLLLLAANLIILPVTITFFNNDLSIYWLVFNCFSDTMFLLDIVVNFRTGIMPADKTEHIILDPKIIAKHYIKSWFILDFFLNLATVFIRIFNLVSIMLLVGHWSGCLQFLVPQMQNFPHDCWIVIANIENSDWFEQYSWSFFKAMSHMLSIGYGRFPPQNLTDMWLTIFSMVSGATCYALFIGHATNLIQSLESANRQYRELMKQVDEYMAYRKLPRTLRMKIQDYFEHKYHGKMFNENIILRELSDTLRQAVINYNCRDLVASVPFFANADNNFVNAIVCNLDYEVFQPGDVIINEGAIGDKMYFIQEGVVDVISGNEVKTSLSEGSYFGEICLMTSDQKRQATIQAATYCHLFSLSRKHFDQVLEFYPMMRKTMESIAAERLTKIGRDPSIVSPKEDLSSYMETVQEVLKAKEKEVLMLQRKQQESKSCKSMFAHTLTDPFIYTAIGGNHTMDDEIYDVTNSMNDNRMVQPISRSHSYSNYSNYISSHFKKRRSKDENSDILTPISTTHEKDKTLTLEDNIQHNNFPGYTDDNTDHVINDTSKKCSPSSIPWSSGLNNLLNVAQALSSKRKSISSIQPQQSTIKEIPDSDEKLSSHYGIMDQGKDSLEKLSMNNLKSDCGIEITFTPPSQEDLEKINKTNILNNSFVTNL